MSRTLREASSRAVARVIGSRFAKPIARVALAAAGLLLLAFIGKTAVAGAMHGASVPSAAPAESLQAAAPVAAPLADPAPHAAPGSASAPAPDPPPAAVSRTHASPEDPVYLNTANVDDLRRLPGIGEKRAGAILSLRARLGGRFRAVEDLLKVKGIGRATLRRLRPLVRLDPPLLDAGIP
jgi:competence protein ComEA